MTTLDKMLELSHNIVSVSASHEEYKERKLQEALDVITQAIEKATTTAPLPPPDVEVIPIEQFRKLQLCVPAGAHDHEFHTPRHFLPGAR